MPKIFDYSYFIGKRFNFFTILEDIGFKQFKKQRERVVIVKCDCGEIKEMRLFYLTAGVIKSCGKCKARCYRHGMAYHPLNRVYSAMKTRCYDKNSVPYPNYGGRGIKICDKWLFDKKRFFEWAFANGYKENLEIDRIDNNGDYEPSNCRWATTLQQARNRRTNKYLTFENKTMTYSEWEEYLGFRKGTIRQRINTYGWGLRRTLTTLVK